MAGTIQCTLTTPEASIYSGEATSVVVPAEDGLLGILPRHAPLVGALGYGELRISTAKGTERFFIDGGFVQVTRGAVSVLAAKATSKAQLSVGAEEAKVAELLAARPKLGAPPEEREAWERSLEIAKRRVKLANR